MKTIILLAFALLLSGCGQDMKTIDAEVEIIGSLPAAIPTERASAVLYRVVVPSDLAGRYGAEFTALGSTEVEMKKGAIFKIQRFGKWRHLLSATPPKASSVSKGEDFFANAVPK